MFRKILTAAAGAIALAGLALPATASAATAPHAQVAATFSQYLAGDQLGYNGLTPFNEIRGTVRTATAENPALPAGTLADGIILQAGVNGGRTAGEGLVYSGPDCTPGQYELEADVTTLTGPGPIALGSLEPLENLSLGASPVCVNAGASYYLEIHYSTRLSEIAFLGGPSEYGNYSDLADVFGVHATFLSPALGTDVTSGADASELSPSSVQASFTRVGVTEPAGFNKGAVAGTRVTFDFFSTNWIESTQNGLAPTITNLVTLFPSAYPAPSSDLTVTAGS